MERRLAAILTADVVGYTARMARDEVGTLKAMETCRALMGGLVRQHGGRVVDAVGDNLLAEFPSAVDAVQCALEIQRQMASAADADADALTLRIGVNVGDLVVLGDRIAGDGVNVAARIEAQAEPGRVAISRSVRDQIEGKIAVAFHDKGEFNLKNVPRPVHIFDVTDADASDADETGTERSTDVAIPGFGGSSAIAVMPFRNLSGDVDQEYFADGLAEDLVTMLGGLRLYPVISHNSTVVYKGQTIDPREVGERLGAHYIVTGSVRRAGERLRVTVELVDAHDGRQVWSSRYDRQMSDVFDVQDEITAAIAGALAPALSQSEMLHAIRRAPQNLGAWDCVHRGMWHLFRYTREGLAKARAWGARALELDQSSVTGHCLMAFTYMYEVIYHWVDDREPSLREAMQYAERAAAIDNEHPMALTALGFACSLNGLRERAVSVLERAVVLNPSSALANWSLGSTLAAAGRPDDAIPMIEKAMRLSPQDPMLNEFLFTIGSAHFMADRYELAIDFARRSLDLRPDQPGSWRVLAAANALLGRMDEARHALGELMRLTPNLTEHRLKTFLEGRLVDKYVDALRKAGWTG